MAQAGPFRDMLNDPDPARSLAAVQLMLDSGQRQLMDIAIDFGLQSAVPEVRRAAVMGLLALRPVLQVRLSVPEDAVEAFETPFRRATGGSVLPDGLALFPVNVGPFDPERNCYVETGTTRCAVEVGPTGLTVRANHFREDTAISNLVFTPEGMLSGSTAVSGYDGGIPSTLFLAD
jgi:hypothetical protein